MSIKLDLKRIIQVDFPEAQYYKEETIKKQLVLHHTVGGSAKSAISWWTTTPERVGTPMIIEKNGDIYQLFSSKYWIHHLGTHAPNNVELNKGSIGVEIVSWGGLIKSEESWYPAKFDSTLKREIANTKLKPITNVQLFPESYRGYYCFEKYTDAQIESLRQLLAYWGDRYNIPLNYNENMFNVSQEALAGKSGIWTHTSYRSDKSDCFSQPELVQMLKSLNNG